ncbi:Polyamine-modulated factor 1, partial [Stegodyphus mimosarum]
MAHAVTVVNEDIVNKDSDTLEGTSKSRSDDDTRISQNEVLLNLPAEDRLKTYFQNAISYTLQKYLDSVKFSVFKREYPELYEKSPSNLREFYKQFKYQLECSARIDLDNLCQQTNIGTLLCELDNVMKENKTNINDHSWRPSGNPEEDIKDHVYQEKQKYREKLKSYLQIIRTEKEELEAELSNNHEAILQ